MRHERMRVKSADAAPPIDRMNVKSTDAAPRIERMKAKSTDPSIEEPSDEPRSARVVSETVP